MTTIGDRQRHHLEVLVDRIGARPPGSPANRRATDHVHASLAAAGRTVTALPFTTRWWQPGAGWLEFGGSRVEVAPNPYSPAGDVQGLAVRMGRLSDLERLEPRADTVLVLADDLAREQVLPAVFPFLSLPEHERIRTALHHLAPAAVVAVSDHWEPILEDPDLAFPSTTVPTAIGGPWRRARRCGSTPPGPSTKARASTCPSGSVRASGGWSCAPIWTRRPRPPAPSTTRPASRRCSP
jgi:hypothetical protein